MRLRLQQFVALSRLAALEALRQRLCLMLATTCVLLTALTPMVITHTFGEDGRLVRDSGLAFHFVFGVLIAGYAASSSLSREIRKGTIAMVLSKPVSRELLFLSKFVGIAAVLLAFSICAVLSTLISERVAERFVRTPQLVGYVVDWQTGWLQLLAPPTAYLAAALLNYRIGRPFESTAFGFLLVFLILVLLISGCFDRTGELRPYHLQVQWRMVPAGILISLGLLVLAAVATALATRLPTASTLTVCTGVFILGLTSDYLFGRHAGTSGWASFCYRIVPNWQHFWASDALSGGGVIPWIYVFHAGVYATAYAAGILCLGALVFRHTEVA